MSYLAKVKYRMLLFQFVLCFFLANIFLSLLISLNYFYLLPNFENLSNTNFSAILIWTFLIISWIAQISLAFLICFMLMSLFSIFIPRFFLVAFLSISLAATLIFSLIADSIAFRLYHMHYATLGWEVLQAQAFSQVISFSYLEIILFIVITCILLFIESIIAWLVWKYVKHNVSGAWRYKLIAISIFCLVTSYTFNFIAKNDTHHWIMDANHSYLITKATRFIPYYDEAYSAFIPTPNAA